MNDSAARLIPLLQLAWQAALDPTAWHPLVAQMAEAFGGAAAIYAHDPISSSANIEEFAVFQPEFMRSYAAHYGPTSPWSAAFRQLPVGTLLTRSLVPEMKLETTEYYNDWLRPQRLHDALGGILGRSGSTGSYVGVLRAADRGDFPDRDKRDFRVLLDALMQATRVYARIERASAQESALHEALDRAGLAAFVIGSTGRLVDHNQRAETMLRAGRAIRSRGGEIAAVQTPADDALRRALAVACATHQASAVLLPEPGSEHPPLVGLVLPMTQAGALLLVKDPSCAALPQAMMLRQVFGLTQAEARLTEALAAGQSLEEIGEHRGISRATLRVQLRSVMSKTGARRQGELIALAHRVAGLEVGWASDRRAGHPARPD